MITVNYSRIGTIIFSIVFIIEADAHHILPLQDIIIRNIVTKKILVRKDILPDSLCMERIQLVLYNPYMSLMKKCMHIQLWATFLKKNSVQEKYAHALIQELREKFDYYLPLQIISPEHLLYNGVMKPCNHMILKYLNSFDTKFIYRLMPNKQTFLEYLITSPSVRPYRIIKELHKKYGLDLSTLFWENTCQSHNLFEILLQQIDSKALLQITEFPGEIESREENLLFLKNYIEQQTGYVRNSLPIQ